MTTVVGLIFLVAIVIVVISSLVRRGNCWLKEANREVFGDGPL